MYTYQIVSNYVKCHQHMFPMLLFLISHPQHQLARRSEVHRASLDPQICVITPRLGVNSWQGAEIKKRRFLSI